MILVLIVFCFGGLCYVREKCSTRESLTNLLIQKWKTAREKRLLWKEKHYDSFNFYDSDYQELWDLEIGAEDLYLLNLPSQGGNVSWSDYISERREFNEAKS
jgi:hypothetical protein